MSSKFAENILIFSRGLRRAGLKLGALEVMNALKALEITEINDKEEFYWVLHANFVKKHEDSFMFHQAFMLYFRKRGLLEKMMETLLPKANLPPDATKKEAGAARLQEAFAPQKPMQEKKAPEIDRDSRETFSNVEILNKKDFAQMSASELNEAFSALKRLKMPLDTLKTRRFEPSNKGAKIDARRSLKAMMASGGDILPLLKKSPKEKPPPLVILLDISGSMSAYSRILLHFVHALMQVRKRVYCYTFGTRLTSITKAMRDKDIDVALQQVTRLVPDWGGGTRLATTLFDFNRNHARRVLGAGAMVLLVTDGLERDNLDELSLNAARLSRMSKRLIWLNPLLRFDGFEPKARGIVALLPHVDEFRPVHNLNSFAALVKALEA